jgi:mycothiol synthase
VPRLDDDRARFLLDRGFGIDHQELTLRRDLALPLPPEPERPGWSISTLPSARAFPLFRQLYEASFAPHRWYQPYSLAELEEEESAGGGAIYFARHGETAVGFAWARRAVGSGVPIEPLGVAPAHAGQGVGRWMLTAVLRRLRQAGVRQVDISTWAENEPALRLYRRLGFTVHDGCYYLAWPPPRA